MSTIFKLRHSPKASFSGAFDVAPAAFIRWNTGLSSSCRRIHSATDSSTTEKMKGSRQPQALKISASMNNRSDTTKVDARISPIIAVVWMKLV